MNYVDYDYYKKEFHGSLGITSFNSFITEACMIVERNVNRKLEPCFITTRVKYVICKIVDLLDEKQKSKLKNDNDVSSVSIDGVSKTYKHVSNAEIESAFKDKLNNELLNLPQELTRYL